MDKETGAAFVVQEGESFTVSFNLQVIPTVDGTVIAVQQNTITNVRGTGVFIGPTTVVVNGTFLDTIAVTMLSSTGIAQTEVGTATIPFSKTISFPQLAGISLTGLSILVSASSPTVATTLGTGNLVGKTVTFNLLTQVVQGGTILTTHPETGEEVETYEVQLEAAPEEQPG